MGKDNNYGADLARLMGRHGKQQKDSERKAEQSKRTSISLPNTGNSNGKAHQNIQAAPKKESPKMDPNIAVTTAIMKDEGKVFIESMVNALNGNTPDSSIGTFLNGVMRHYPGLQDNLDGKDTPEDLNVQAVAYIFGTDELSKKLMDMFLGKTDVSDVTDDMYVLIGALYNLNPDVIVPVNILSKDTIVFVFAGKKDKDTAARYYFSVKDAKKAGNTIIDSGSYRWMDLHRGEIGNEATLEEVIKYLNAIRKEKESKIKAAAAATDSGADNS